MKLGDWVLFQRGGLPVIGIVLVEPRDSKCYPYEPELMTTAGWLRMKDVIECRREKL